jgi:cardiolipin synthase
MTTHRVLTIPNAITGLRLLALPVLVWLILTDRYGWALSVLIAAGVSDYLDGVVARATGQVSRLGEILDPIADRLYIAATLVAMALGSIIPWWLLAILLARDLTVGVFLIILKRHGVTGIPVTFLGKTATFLLLWGFPFLLAGAIDWAGADVSRIIGWGLILWGTFLYWWVGLEYVGAIRAKLRPPR